MTNLSTFFVNGTHQTSQSTNCCSVLERSLVQTPTQTLLSDVTCFTWYLQGHARMVPQSRSQALQHPFHYPLIILPFSATSNVIKWAIDNYILKKPDEKAPDDRLHMQRFIKLILRNILSLWKFTAQNFSSWVTMKLLCEKLIRSCVNHLSKWPTAKSFQTLFSHRNLHVCDLL